MREQITASRGFPHNVQTVRLDRHHDKIGPVAIMPLRGFLNLRGCREMNVAILEVDAGPAEPALSHGVLPDCGVTDLVDEAHHRSPC